MDLKQINSNVPEKINRENIRNFLEGNLNRFRKSSLPLFILEQVNYRSFLCQPCLSNGKCLNCGCTTPHMFYAPNKKDPNWGPLITEEKEWDIKKEQDAKFTKFIKFADSIGLDPLDAGFPVKLRNYLSDQATGRAKESNRHIQEESNKNLPELNANGERA